MERKYESRIGYSAATPLTNKRDEIHTPPCVVNGDSAKEIGRSNISQRIA